jgi:Domain of unknown function (DUF4349)
MRTFRRADRAVPIALLLLLITILIAACAGGGSAGRLNGVGDNPVPGNGQAAPGGGDDGPGTPAEAPASPGSENPDAVGAIDDAKIIRTGTMDLEVSDVPGAIREARDAIRTMGGYIGASRTSNVDDKPYAEITYRIPVDRWEDALDALRALNGMTTKVVTEQTEAVDVTGQVVDLEARIRNLRASETALQGIAEQATRIPDILEIQAQITNVRGQIEQLEAQRNALADQTTYATLTVSYQLPVVAAVEVQAEGWDPAAIFDEATASIVSVFQALAGAAIWLAVVWLPILVMVSIVGGVAVWLLRRFGVLERSLRPTPPAASGD